MVTAALNSSQAAKGHGNAREAPQSSVPPQLTWQEELEATQCYQSTLPTFVPLCSPTLRAVGLTTPPLKAFPAQMSERWKVHQECNCRATLKYKHNLELQHKQDLSRGLKFFAESIYQHHYLYI